MAGCPNHKPQYSTAQCGGQYHAINILTIRSGVTVERLCHMLTIRSGVPVMDVLEWKETLKLWFSSVWIYSLFGGRCRWLGWEWIATLKKTGLIFPSSSLISWKNRQETDYNFFPLGVLGAFCVRQNFLSFYFSSQFLFRRYADPWNLGPRTSFSGNCC